VEVLSGDEGEMVHVGRITPVHAASEGITSRTIRELVFRALDRLGPVAEILPDEVVQDEGLLDEDRALRWIHFPEDDGTLERARERLKFDELFTLELGVAYRKRRLERHATGVPHAVEGELVDRFLAGLPFEPTAAQRRAMKEIAADMAATRPMNRLLQGDVGSGKTLVALHAAILAIRSGHQAVIMAPTEVLAGQHLKNVAGLLAGVGARNVLGLGPATGTRARGAGTRDQESLFGAPAGPPGHAPGVPVGGDDPPTFALLSAAVTGRDR